MQPVTPGAQRYDGRTILFHWATFLLVALQFAGAWTIDDFPRGPLRVDARSFHVTVGALLALLLLARLIWRWTGGRRLPAADRGLVHVLAKATHWGLYVVLSTMVSVGFFLTWARGDNLWNRFQIPKFDPALPGLGNQVQDIHALIGWIILGLVGLHAMAAIAHRLLWKDGVLGRMLPGHARLASTNAVTQD